MEPLEELIEEWKQFQPHEIFDTGVVDQDLSAISQSFQALEKCVGKLKRLQNDCNRFHKGVRVKMPSIKTYGVRTSVLTCDGIDHSVHDRGSSSRVQIPDKTYSYHPHINHSYDIGQYVSFSDVVSSLLTL